MGIETLQHYAETSLERSLQRGLQAEGIVAEVRFRFASNRASEALRDAQTRQFEIDNDTTLYWQGLITQEDFAMRTTGHAPANPAPIAVPRAFVLMEELMAGIEATHTQIDATRAGIERADKQVEADAAAAEALKDHANPRGGVGTGAGGDPEGKGGASPTPGQGGSNQKKDSTKGEQTRPKSQSRPGRPARPQNAAQDQAKAGRAGGIADIWLDEDDEEIFYVPDAEWDERPIRSRGVAGNWRFWSDGRDERGGR